MMKRRENNRFFIYQKFEFQNLIFFLENEKLDHYFITLIRIYPLTYNMLL